MIYILLPFTVTVCTLKCELVKTQHKIDVSNSNRSFETLQGIISCQLLENYRYTFKVNTKTTLTNSNKTISLCIR